MPIYDVSIGITPTMPVWPGNPGVELERVNDMDKGANSNVSRLALGVHTGTHVDAPLHFAGAPGVETLPLSVLIMARFTCPRSTGDGRRLESAIIPWHPPPADQDPQLNLLGRVTPSFTPTRGGDDAAAGW
jgi:arylformamidase